MHRLTTAALAVGLLATLTACSNEPASPTVSKTSSSPEPAAATSTPAPTPTDTTYKLGETAKVNDAPNGVVFTATVIAYTQPVKGPQPPDPATQGGDVWATVEAKICNEAKTVTVSQFPWSLAYADGTVVKVTGSSGGDMPKPEFPMDVPIKAGRCVKGKIPFPVMGNSRPERIVYAPESLSADPVEWAVPKA
jgi:cytoskeletal protein RodZ